MQIRSVLIQPKWSTAACGPRLEPCGTPHDLSPTQVDHRPVYQVGPDSAAEVVRHSVGAESLAKRVNIAPFYSYIAPEL